MENFPRERPFTSWKEIAAYLGCDERTCLRWEKQHALPVHRAGGGKSKSLVFAYKDELDEWLRHRRGESGPPPTEPQPPIAKHSGGKLTLYLGLMTLVVLAGLAAWRLVGRPSRLELKQPYDFRIERSTFIALNKEGLELWRYDTKVDGLIDDAAYHRLFGPRRIDAEDQPMHPLVQIEDIDGDGRSEVLFTIRTFDDSSRSLLLCFDSAGRKQWTYEPGREMVYGSRRYSADYIIDAADILDLGPGQLKKVFVMARQKPDWPSFIAVLSPEGKQLGEYWNSGRIQDYVLADIDGDGNMALVLVGTNNEYSKGFLSVVDPDFAWGSSPQTGDYRCADLKPGSEFFYLLFPRTEVDRIVFEQREAISFVDALRNSRIMAVSQGGRIIYELNRKMEVDAPIISDYYREKYRKFQAQGLIGPGRLNEPALIESLRRSIVYYDGEHWTTTPTRNKRNLGIFLEKESRVRPPTGH